MLEGPAKPLPRRLPPVRADERRPDLGGTIAGAWGNIPSLANLLSRQLQPLKDSESHGHAWLRRHRLADGSVRGKNRETGGTTQRSARRNWEEGRRGATEVWSTAAPAFHHRSTNESGQSAASQPTMNMGCRRPGWSQLSSHRPAPSYWPTDPSSPQVPGQSPGQASLPALTAPMIGRHHWANMP